MAHRVSLFTVLALQPILTGAAMLNGLDKNGAVLLYFAFWTGTGWLITVNLERRFWCMALGYTVGMLASARWPMLWPFVMSACHFVCTVNIFWVWRQPGTLLEPLSAAPPSTGLGRPHPR